MTIDLLKLVRYVLKRIWLPILLAVIGFGGMFYRAEYLTPDTYTATATMYVLNGNPNIVNYQYTNVSDLNTAVMLVDTYKVVIRSNKVMDTVAERLDSRIPTEYLASTISVGSISETGVMCIYCTTGDAQLSMDICNAVADIAPAEIVRVVSAGSVEVIDYAELPQAPNSHQSLKNGVLGALAGGVLGCGILLLLFLLNRKLTDSKELTDNYNLALLATIPRQKKNRSYVINQETSSHVLASYGKLRMNLYFALHGSTKVVLVTSSIPGESKSTLATNLAISMGMDGKHTLLIDGDLRKPTQNKLLELNALEGGLSDMLVPEAGQKAMIHKNVRQNLDVLTAGTIPPNPSELLNSKQMRELIKKMEQEYDLIILDTPPVNVVPDALVLSDTDVGLLFVTRCGYSDHREIRKALTAIEFTQVHVLGTVMTCANNTSDGYYNGRYYKHYYSAYDHYKPTGKRNGTGKTSD